MKVSLTHVFLPAKKETNQQWPQILSIYIVTLTSISAGALYAWPSPTIPILIAEGNITFEETSYFAFIPAVAQMAISLFVGKTVDYIGRKYVLLFSAIPHLVAWILIAFGDSLLLYYISSFLTGIGNCTAWVALPAYVGEISEPKIRGSWGNVITSGSFFGVFLMNVIGSYCSIRNAALLFATIPVIFSLIFVFMPESPYYYISLGQIDKARAALVKLRWTENVDEELTQLVVDVQRQMSESGTYRDIFTVDSNRRAVLISSSIRLISQFSGIVAFVVYTQYMFQEAGGDISKTTSSIIFTGALLVVIFFAGFVQDKFGRRPLLISSSIACAIILTLEAIYFAFKQFNFVDTSSFHWFPLVGMIMYIVAYSMGMGIINILIAGELFSASIKGKAVSILMLCTGFSICVGSKLFQIFTEKYGLYSSFCFFAVVCYVGTIYSYLYMPETRGKTLEEIQQILKKKPVENYSINAVVVEKK